VLLIALDRLTCNHFCINFGFLRPAFDIFASHNPDSCNHVSKSKCVRRLQVCRIVLDCIARICSWYDRARKRNACEPRDSNCEVNVQYTNRRKDPTDITPFPAFPTRLPTIPQWRGYDDTINTFETDRNLPPALRQPPYVQPHNPKAFTTIVKDLTALALTTTLHHRHQLKVYNRKVLRSFAEISMQRQN
jgi:hypothetical protein